MLCLVLLTSPAMAHKVVLFAWVENGMIHAEAGFGSKRPAQKCIVQAYTADKNMVYQGITDEQGQLSFPIPLPIVSDLALKLVAGTGHLGQWVIPENELKTEPPTDELSKKMAEKEKLEKPPSLYRILAGIGLIFGLALMVRWMKLRQTKANHD